MNKNFVKLIVVELAGIMIVANSPILVGVADWHPPSRTLALGLRSAGVQVREVTDDMPEADLLRQGGTMHPGTVRVPEMGLIRGKTMDGLKLRRDACEVSVGEANIFGAVAVLYDDRKGLARVWRALNPEDKTAMLCCAAALGAKHVARFCIGKLHNQLSVADGKVSGNTALHYAALGNQEAIVDLLLQHGADPSALNPAFTQPMHDAARSGSAGALIALKKHGVDLTATNRYGDTLIQRVAEFILEDESVSYEAVYRVCRDDFVERCGASALPSFLNHVNKNGYVALDVAVVRGQEHFAAILRADGASHSAAWHAMDPQRRTFENLSHVREWQAIATQINA